jgi:hypothetical protein
VLGKVPVTARNVQFEKPYNRAIDDLVADPLRITHRRTIERSIADGFV